jgi:hypothetical protein
MQLMIQTSFGNRRIACIILAIGIAIAALGLTNNGPFIKGAKTYSQDIAQSSAVTYLSLRLINAAVSFAEEVEVGGSVIAVNGSAHPFKVLEPVDDAVERLSSAIFLVGTISGIMTVVLPVLGGVTLVMIGTALALLAGLDLIGLGFPGRNAAANLLCGVARLGGLGFLVVIAFSISSWFVEGVSDRAWGQYQATLTDIAQQMPNLSDEAVVMPDVAEVDDVLVPDLPESAAEDSSFLNRTMDGLRSAGEGAVNAASAAASGVENLASGAINGVKNAASSASASYTKAKEIVVVLSTQSDELVQALMGVFAAFLFKTVVCPLLILIGLWKLTGSVDFMRKNSHNQGSIQTANNRLFDPAD